MKTRKFDQNLTTFSVRVLLSKNKRSPNDFQNKFLIYNFLIYKSIDWFTYPKILQISIYLNFDFLKGMATGVHQLN